MTEELTQIIAWLALAISLFGGIPGLIMTYESLTKSPKLNIVYRNSISGDLINNQTRKSFILIVFTIGNKGYANFKRFVNPKAELLIEKKWIKLRAVGLSDEFIDKICDQFPQSNDANVIEALKLKKIPDYYFNNFTIEPNESYDVFLFFDTEEIMDNNIHNASSIKITFTDVKGKDYNLTMKLKQNR